MIPRGDPGLPSRLFICGAASICLTVLAACSTPPFAGRKSPATGVPPTSQTPSGPGGVSTEEAAPSFDPAILQREIQRRRVVLEGARDNLGRLESEVERSALNARIQALEDQVHLLERIQLEIARRPATADPVVAAARSKRLAAELLEALSLAHLEPPAAPEAIPGEGASTSWDSLRSAYKEGDCSGVLDAYAAMSRERRSVTAVPVDVQVLHALCLARVGRIGEAIGEVEPLLTEQAQLLDAHYLQYLLANWLYQQGDMARAEETYRSLLRGDLERQRWSDLAKLRLEQVRLSRGEPPSTEEPQEPAEPVFALPMPVEAAPKGATPPLKPTPSAGTPSPPSLEEIRTARLQEAQHHLDNERYEEAILAFQGLLGTEYDSQALEGIRQAQDHYAENRRRQAASLVLQAHAKGDPESRKALLLQALGILQETNTRYPGNRYATKIVQNIQDVIAQIQKMDPTFHSETRLGPSQGEVSP